MALGRARQPQDVQTKDIIDYQLDAENIKGMRQLGQKRGMDLMQQGFQIDDEVKAKADAEHFGALFEKHGGDIEAAWPEMLATNPAMAFKIRQLEDQSRRDAGQSLRTHLENELTMRTSVASIIDGIDLEDENALQMWEQARGQIGQVDPDTADAMPAEPDPAWLEQTVQSSMTEREAGEARMQALTEVVDGEATRGYGRALGRADSAEEYGATRETFRGLPNMTMDIINQYPEHAPQDPEEFAAFIGRIREAGQDPRDTAAMERAELQHEGVMARLEVEKERNRINELRYLQGDDNALMDLHGSGTPASALFKLGMMRLGETYPKGMSSPDVDGVSYLDAVDALNARVSALPASKATGGDAAGIRKGNEWEAEQLQLLGPPPPPRPEGSEEAHAQYGQNVQRIQELAEVMRSGGGPASLPYAGERNTSYATMSQQVRQRIEGILREAKQAVTPANVESYLERFPEVAEGESGSPPTTIGAFGRSMREPRGARQ